MCKEEICFKELELTVPVNDTNFESSCVIELENLLKLGEKNWFRPVHELRSCAELDLREDGMEEWYPLNVKKIDSQSNLTVVCRKIPN